MRYGYDQCFKHKAIPCQFSGSGQVTVSNSPEILLELSLSHMINIYRFEWNLSRNGMIIKLFSWGVFSRRAQIVHIWPCLKPMFGNCQTTSVNNPNFLGMLVTLPNIKKITLSTLWLSKVKGHKHPKLTVSSSCYKFLKIFKPCHSFISWYFLLIFGRIVADKIIIDLTKFYCKISKGCQISWAKLSTKWKNLEKWGTFVASVTHDRSENSHWKNFHIFILIWQVYYTKFMDGSQCFHREKLWQNLCKNYKFYIIQRS